jgi:hypothetical protein
VDEDAEGALAIEGDHPGVLFVAALAALRAGDVSLDEIGPCASPSAFSATGSTRRRTRSAAIPETNPRKSITCPSYTVYARMEFVARTRRR